MSAAAAGPFAGEGRAMLLGLALGIGVIALMLVRFPVLAKKADHILPLDPACTLSTGECTRTLPDGTEIRMRLDPDQPAALKPFDVDVRVFGGEAIRVEFAVRDADGGLDQAPLERVGPGHWQGQGRLSWCGNAAMTATALVDSNGREWRVPFAFEMEPAR
ncbi:MAG TPA: hypothetical protein VF811_08600 [Parasulfuritortus sp.]